MAVFIILFVLSFVVAGVHIYRDKQPRTGKRLAEILLLWFLVINTGLGGLYAFMGHTFAANEVAESIGWPTGNPFQTEVAVANLAIGTLGILSYWIRRCPLSLRGSPTRRPPLADTGLGRVH